MIYNKCQKRNISLSKLKYRKKIKCDINLTDLINLINFCDK